MLLVFKTLVTRAPPDFWVSDAHSVDYDFAHNVDYYSFYDFAAVSSAATAPTTTRRLHYFVLDYWPYLRPLPAQRHAALPAH